MNLLSEEIRSALLLVSTDQRFIGLEQQYTVRLAEALAQINGAQNVDDLWQDYNNHISGFRRQSRWYSKYSRETDRLDTSLRSLDSALRRIDQFEMERESFWEANLPEVIKTALQLGRNLKESANGFLDALSDQVRTELYKTQECGRQYRRIAQRKVFWFKLRSSYLKWIENTFYGLVLCTIVAGWVREKLFKGWVAFVALVAWYFVKHCWIDRLIKRKILEGEKLRLSNATVYLYRVLFLSEYQNLLLQDQIMQAKGKLIKRIEQMRDPGNCATAPQVDAQV